MFGVAALLLVPWVVLLVLLLPSAHQAAHWDIAWSGFDAGLAIAFLLTAVAAWRKSPWVGACAAATGTLLVTDAWFDIVLESHSDELRNAVYLAVLAELPIAALCFLIAYRTERFLALLVEQVLHLAPAAQRPSQSDLIGVLEVTADGKTTGEPRDANPSP